MVVKLQKLLDTYNNSTPDRASFLYVLAKQIQQNGGCKISDLIENAPGGTGATKANVTKKITELQKAGIDILTQNDGSEVVLNISLDTIEEFLQNIETKLSLEQLIENFKKLAPDQASFFYIVAEQTQQEGGCAISDLIGNALGETQKDRRETVTKKITTLKKAGIDILTQNGPKITFLNISPSTVQEFLQEFNTEITLDELQDLYKNRLTDHRAYFLYIVVKTIHQKGSCKIDDLLDEVTGETVEDKLQNLWRTINKINGAISEIDDADIRPILTRGGPVVNPRDKLILLPNISPETLEEFLQIEITLEQLIEIHNKLEEQSQPYYIALLKKAQNGEKIDLINDAPEGQDGQTFIKGITEIIKQANLRARRTILTLTDQSEIVPENIAPNVLEEFLEKFEKIPLKKLIEIHNELEEQSQPYYIALLRKVQNGEKIGLINNAPDGQDGQTFIKGIIEEVNRLAGRTILTQTDGSRVVSENIAPNTLEDFLKDFEKKITLKELQEIHKKLLTKKQKNLLRTIAEQTQQKGGCKIDNLFDEPTGDKEKRRAKQTNIKRIITKINNIYIRTLLAIDTDGTISFPNVDPETIGKYLQELEEETLNKAQNTLEVEEPKTPVTVEKLLEIYHGFQANRPNLMRALLENTSGEGCKPEDLFKHLQSDKRENQLKNIGLIIKEINQKAGIGIVFKNAKTKSIVLYPIHKVAVTEFLKRTPNATKPELSAHSGKPTPKKPEPSKKPTPKKPELSKKPTPKKLKPFKKPNPTGKTKANDLSPEQQQRLIVKRAYRRCRT